jgi:hypothetical protein
VAPLFEAERKRILDAFLATGRPPEPSPLWPQLAAARWIVLDDHGGLRMAHPFSGVETDFVVAGAEQTWFANCFWDALAVSAMVLHRLAQPTVIHTHCGYSRQPLRLAVGPQGPPPGEEHIHFAVPLRDWWNDIVFT